MKSYLSNILLNRKYCFNIVRCFGTHFHKLDLLFVGKPFRLFKSDLAVPIEVGLVPSQDELQLGVAILLCIVQPFAYIEKRISSISTN